MLVWGGETITTVATGPETVCMWRYDPPESAAQQGRWRCSAKFSREQLGTAAPQSRVGAVTWSEGGKRCLFGGKDARGHQSYNDVWCFEMGHWAEVEASWAHHMLTLALSLTPTAARLAGKRSAWQSLPATWLGVVAAAWGGLALGRGGDPNLCQLCWGLRDRRSVGPPHPNFRDKRHRGQARLDPGGPIHDKTLREGRRRRVVAPGCRPNEGGRLGVSLWWSGSFGAAR